MSSKGYGFLILVVAVIAILVGTSLYNGRMDRDSYTYSQFTQDLKDKKVRSALIRQNSEVPTGRLVLEMTGNVEQTLYVPDVSTALQDLKTAGITDITIEDVDRTPWYMQILPYVFGFIMMLLLLSLLSGQGAGSAGGGGSMMNFGKSRARMMSPEDKEKKTFADVAGLFEEKEQLEEVVDFLASPDKYTKLGARIPKGIILVGPPGTGKTLLAKSVAGEAGVPFFSISGSDFVEMFVGVGASRVRDLFTEAKKNSPCIVFIDEIDAVARRRGSGLGGGHDEREQTLNQMLVEMDGFGVNEGIIVMAATNRVDILDPAILRPGRFDRKIYVGVPDVRGREEILRVHARNKPLGDTVDLDEVARTTAGFTGADLENLMNESAIRAARENRSFINDEDIKKSFIKVGIGTEKKSRVISDKDKKITAFHEAGHAILFHVLPDVGHVYAVSVIPPGQGAGGYTMPLPERDEMYMTKGRMLQNIIVSLGGRIAESLIFDDVTTGASMDIRQATEAARDMVTKYGFSDELGMVNYSTSDDEVFIGRDIGHTKNFSEGTSEIIDREVKRIIDESYEKATGILKENLDLLHRIADRLIEKERIGKEEFESLFE
ncbi:MAG: ATP-dependent zinc metalloprotease FtsH [Eubacterium sp.]|nr:ATP-dependent zinc metalloprotease FtsH [Eubacterium sp.]